MKEKELLNSILKHHIQGFETAYAEEKNKLRDKETQKVYFGMASGHLEFIRAFGELINPELMKEFKKRNKYYF